jgi:hypothetical protein
VTPQIGHLGVFWTENTTPLSSTVIEFTGQKTIGTNASGDAIYKVDQSLITNSNGEIEIDDLEFDSYTFTSAAGLDIASACPGYPIVHEAGVDTDGEYVLIPNETNTLRVHVTDAAGRYLPGATVALSRPGYNQNRLTNACGQVFFTGGVSTSNDYTLNVSAPGYSVETITALEINGDEVVQLPLYDI